MRWKRHDVKLLLGRENVEGRCAIFRGVEYDDYDNALAYVSQNNGVERGEIEGETSNERSNEISGGRSREKERSREGSRERSREGSRKEVPRGLSKSSA